MKRPLKSWNDFLTYAGASRYQRRQLRAMDDPDYRAHVDAVRRLPSAVREAWELYVNDANNEVYPFGFAYHFPLQWRWMELQAAGANGEERLSQRALKAADLGPDTERRPGGDVDRWPSGRPMGANSPGIDPDFHDVVDEDVTGYWRDQHNGRLYVIDQNGVVLDEVGDVADDDEDPPF